MKPRGLLVANPNATSTSPRVRDIITRALAGEADLEVITTTHRGHAEQLAAEARDLDLLVTLGGDGTINEVVNGLMNNPLMNAGQERRPMLATIPGGSANVMARALGFPNEAIEATGMILESLRTQTSHSIGLGAARFRTVDPEAKDPDTAEPDDSPAPAATPEATASSSATAAPMAEYSDASGHDTYQHWFTINAGVGLDADVLAAMEALRADGRAATPARYARVAATQYFRTPERTKGLFSLELPGEDLVENLALVIVQNTAPWTYFGPMPINPLPDASFDKGLDVFAPHSLGIVSTARFGLRMLRGSHAGEVAGRLTLLHDRSEFVVRCARPAGLQVDGDHLGFVREVAFRAVPEALTIVG